MQWPHDDMQSKINFFGDPRKSGFEEVHLINLTPSYQMFYDRHPIKTIRVNRRIAPSLILVFEEIWKECGRDQNQVNLLGLSSYGGCYNYRPIRGSRNLSNHAFGAAIDIDPENNPLGAKVGKMPQLAIVAFKNQGFLWGGDYKGRKDWMHFEAVSR